MHITQTWFRLFDRDLPNIILRLIIMFTGLASLAFGVALSRATGLGTSPISCLPATFSFMSDWTIGTYTLVLNILFVGVQIALLRRNFNPVQLLQVVFVFIFSLLIDFFVDLVSVIPMPDYPTCLAFMLLSCVFTGFGVFLEVKAALVMLPGEGIVLAVAYVSGREFAPCKVAFDCTNVVVAAIISLVGMGGLYGVREGTVVAAISTGFIVRFFNKIFPHFDRFAPVDGHLSLAPHAEQNEDTDGATAAEKHRS